MLRRSAIGALAVIGWLATGGAAAWAAPPNDDFEHTRVLGSAPVTVPGTLDGATVQPGGPDDHQRADVWYSFTAAARGPVSVEMPQRSGPVNDPPSIYTGSDLQHLVPVDTKEQDPWWGRALFDAVAGRTYRIMVSGWEPRGTFALRVRPATAPSNDDFADARHVRVPGLYRGNLEDATSELGEPQPPGRATAWYRIRPRHTSRLTVEADSANCNASVAAFTGSRLGSLHRIAERFPTIRFKARKKHVYWLRVSCPGGYVGDYTLDVSDGSIKGKGVHMKVEPGQTIGSVRRRGLRLDVGARRKVKVSIDLRVDRRTARRLHSRDRVIGRVSGWLGYRQDAPATIRLERGARRALAHRHRLDAKLRLTLRDHAPNRVMHVPVHLRRATMGA